MAPNISEIGIFLKITTGQVAVTIVRACVFESKLPDQMSPVEKTIPTQRPSILLRNAAFYRATEDPLCPAKPGQRILS